MTNSYAGLASHYNLIMSSGYYDYGAYAQHLSRCLGDSRDLLELGVGTGLMCERLLKIAPEKKLRITGVDHTADMLTQAQARLGSHLPDDAANAKGLENVAAMLRPGGLLLLSIQEAPHAYARPLPGGLVYEQDIDDHGGGLFTKHYTVKQGDAVVAQQSSPYRLYSMKQADELLEDHGFHPHANGPDVLFKQLTRR
ncbi:class I SAM-dependent methyltransferase [Streptomyces cavernicola]|uniref:Class I SAM-dependent methyltransferase n=1 Tax=Streptomyces cavernicola TaxID=3043613 RepID=A0ABT6SB46_9ACTN|nr:class I SAM-dependent methyltransferase [Streptomyces sp. B-S-A6]MDI3405104.1 class I SAM-dependent methyltransferase [Streptomyces sp. B-S-A6]